MTLPRHEPWDELISASLTGDLSADERRRLDAHLDTCEACRATLAAFTDQRRIVSGVRHLPPPRDLGARVRAGIERGDFASVPWWRRPPTLAAAGGGALALVAGALLALVILGDPERNVGEATPTPAVTATAMTTESPRATFPVGPTPTPTVDPQPTPDPTPAAEPTPTPIAPEPEPDLFLALTGPADNLALTVRDGVSGDTVFEPDTPPGPPIAAELSPDGQWLAYLTRVGESGRHEVRATRVSEGIPSDDPEALSPADSPIGVGETVVLGESISGSPFLERLTWSWPRSLYLAYTVLDPEDGSIDVWVFEPALGEPYQLTDGVNAYAASWIPGSAGTSLLWLSVADEEPVSHLIAFHDDARSSPPDPFDPADAAIATVEHVFQPILSPDGRFAIYWDGRMDRIGDDMVFVGAGQPYLAEHLAETETFGFTSERPLFADVQVGRDGFASGAIAWSGDSIAYAVWNAQWTGAPQSGAGEDPYPDAARVYFGRATDPRGLTRVHAIDRGDVPAGSTVVDVKVAPTGEHLVITALRPIGGVLEAPSADLLLVERNTGDEPDAVSVIGDGDRGWFGPAAFDGDPRAAVRD